MTATGTRYDSPIVTDRSNELAGLATVVPRADFDLFQASAKARGITKGALLREVVHAFVEWQLVMAKLADGYDATDDFAKSIEEAYRVIRERKANGGKGWTPP